MRAPIPLLLLAASGLLAGCGREEEPVEAKYARQKAAIEDKARALEAQVENEIGAIEARLEAEGARPDPGANAAAGNAAAPARE